MIFLLYLLLAYSTITGCNCSNFECNIDIPTILLPRQLAYNPILENALTAERKFCIGDFDYYLSLKPIFTKAVGCKLKRYFNIKHKQTLEIRELGTGDINANWFETIAQGAPPLYYSSNLSMCPDTYTLGSLINFEAPFRNCYYFSLNTALVARKNKITLLEEDIQNLGTVKGFRTISESFENPNREYGKICSGKTHKKVGLDDIQIKIGRYFHNPDCSRYLNAYFLIGIPTGSKTKNVYLFEPLVGSRGLQIGLGANGMKNLVSKSCCEINILGEIKWRYGFSGNDRRIFDLYQNGEWSRYMLFTDKENPYTTTLASNNLVFDTKVSQRNALDIYLAGHVNRNNWNFELGYDFFYRQREKVLFNNQCNQLKSNLGIADLVGINALNATTASTANISQSLVDGPNRMKSDATFLTIKESDLNLNSGAQPEQKSNSVYFSCGYDFDCACYPTQLGLNVAYERGTDINKPDEVFAWINFDIAF